MFSVAFVNSFQCNTWHSLSIFETWCNSKFHNKEKIFSHPALYHGHWQWFWRRSRRQWGQLAVAVLRGHKRRLVECGLQVPKYFYWLRHEAPWSFWQIGAGGFRGLGRRQKFGFHNFTKHWGIVWRRLRVLGWFYKALKVKLPLTHW